jgi:hypothetical protein
MEAIVLSLLLQAPPAVELVSVEVAPVQRVFTPEMGNNDITVSVSVDTQPLGSV